MRLFVTVNGKPAIVVAYMQGESGPQAIVLGLGDCPKAVPLGMCKLPKVPKKLVRKMKATARGETREAQRALIERGHMDA